ncbi:Transcriptional regulator, TetR family [Cystobacter fuscus DSM 2262]|uniref:Transcriptional regulator, TetR family n=1 Tax=Cystobacter fuscus (strain ATCC 25194 / DSM 2262 / NBRC 100088 / M29) TaxID=1242864 RepID=S9Q2P5_CYSF2|nr:TetR family transcriptional regulator [Cystobacter fuscus]EPX55559.1 Transcriptional regulator, TetR family [Cystobacter fuscus DSM 2262]
MDERSKSPEQPNLRERKQRLLRLELGEVALRLFVERGFAETTIEDIAEAAGISRRTFFRYFETKEDVVLWRLRYSSEQIGASLEARPADEPPLLAVRKALDAVSEAYITEPERYRSYLRFLLETPTLRAHFLDTQEQWRALLSRILAARLGAGRGKKELAQLTAAVAVAAQDVALRRWAEDGSRSLPDYVDETFAALPEVLAASPGPSAPAAKRARR